MKTKFLNTLKIYFAFVLFLIVISLLAYKLLPFRPQFPYYDAILANLSSVQLIWHWANFDGVHYITIADKGYIGTGLIQAYFPLYPLLVGWINKIIGNPLYSGLLFSNISFLLALYFFQKLLKVEKIKDKKWPILFLLLFPTSFYFIGLYSESLFLLLTILSFLSMRQKKWFQASVFASLASATRLVGIFIAPALILEYNQSLTKLRKKNKLVKLKQLLLFIISIGGFLLYCWYLNKNFGDPFFFARVQSKFGASRQTDKIILFHQVTWRYIKMLVTVKNNNLLYYAVAQEFFLSLGVLAVFIWGWFKKIKRSYLVYAFFSFILPTLTGNLSSMPRYVAVIFPLYLILSKIKNKKVKICLLIVSTILLIINTALFLRGSWIA